MKVSNLVPTTIKIFVSTALFIVLFTVLFEFYNTRIHSIELAHLTRQIMNKSCRFMQQESYRGSITDDGKIKTFGNSYYIKDAAGAIKVTGKFYEGTDMRSIYENLFTSDANTYHLSYINWLDTELHDKGFNSSTFKQGSSYEMLKNLMSETNTDTGANSLGAELMITPANLGFTYLDPEVLKRVFKWKLVNRLTANSVQRQDYTRRSLLLRDTYGDYVQWYGFRIYYDTLTLDIEPTNGRLKLYDLNSNDDVEELQKWTGIDIDRYRYGGNNDDSTNNVEGNMISDNDIRRYKILYDIRWSMKIGYEGILPIKQVMSLFQDGDSESLVLSDDGNPFLSNFSNPLDIHTRRPNNIRTTVNSDANTIQGNELFGSPAVMGNDEAQGGKMGNFEDTEYRYNQENQHLGVGGGEGVIGLGQRLKYVVIY